MAVDTVLVLRVYPAHDNTKCRHSTYSNYKHHCSTRKMTQLTTRTCTPIGSNSFCGGARRLEITYISTPNDDVLEGDFEFSQGSSTMKL